MALIVSIPADDQPLPSPSLTRWRVADAQAGPLGRRIQRCAWHQEIVGSRNGQLGSPPTIDSGSLAPVRVCINRRVANPSLSDSAIIEDDYAVGSNEFPVQGDILTRIQARNGFQLRETALNVPIPLR